METSFVDSVAGTTPWLAPVIPAWMAYHNMTSVMSFPWGVAFIGALVVECLGMSTVTTAVQFWDWNDKKRISDQAAPVNVALGTAGFYLAIILIVNVLLDMSDWLQCLAKLLLSTLSIIGAVTLAIRSQHRRRVLDIEAEKQAKRQERHEKLQDKYKMITRSDEIIKRQKLVVRFDWRALSENDKMCFAELTAEEISRQYPGISNRTIGDWRRRSKKLNVPF